MAHQLKGKTALITGAGRGIGEAVAKVFAQQGASVVVLDVNYDLAEKVTKDIQQAGGEAMSVVADVSKEGEMKQAFEHIVSRFGALDVLVNNAAVQIIGPLHEFTEEQYDQVVNVNLKGVFIGCKMALPIMMKQRSGVILSISSVLGVVGDHDMGIYGATKGAVIALTKSLAVSYGAYGIRANCVCPGDVNTPMVQHYFDSQPVPAEAREQVSRHYSLKRIAEPEEVANTLVFLASDEASFISGGSIFVDGGLTSEVY